MATQLVPLTSEELAGLQPVLSSTPENQYGLMDRTTRVLDMLQAAYDNQLKINSGRRTEEKNRAVDGVPGSLHLKGQAVDIDVDNLTKANRKDIIARAKAIEGVEAIDEGDHIHVEDNIGVFEEEPEKTKAATSGLVPLSGSDLSNLGIAQEPGVAAATGGQGASGDKFAAQHALANKVLTEPAEIPDWATKRLLPAEVVNPAYGLYKNVIEPKIQGPLQKLQESKIPLEAVFPPLAIPKHLMSKPVLNTYENITEGMTSPVNLGLLAFGKMNPGLARQAMVGFLPQFAKGTYEGGKGTYKALKEGDKEQAVEQGIGTAANAAMFGLGALNVKPMPYGAKPRITPETPLSELRTPFESAVETVKTALKEAKPVTKASMAKLHAERQAAVAKSVAAGKGLQGLEQFRAEKGALKKQIDPKVLSKGFTEAPDVVEPPLYTPIFDKIPPQELTAILDKIHNAPGFMHLETIRARDAFMKLAHGQRLQPKEFELLSETLPGSVMREAFNKQGQAGAALSPIADIYNFTKSTASMMDISFPRQGAFLMGDFKISVPALINAHKYVVSEKAAINSLVAMKAHTNYRLMRQGGLKIPDLGDDVLPWFKEEAYQSNLPKKLPEPWGSIARASERSFTVPLYEMRFNKFNKILARAQKLIAQGKQPTDLIDDKWLKGLVDYVNTATGRGNMGEMLNKAQGLTNTLLYSPRLQYSRMQLMNPAYYAKLPKVVRAEAIRDLLRFVSLDATVLLLAKQAGAEIETDPTSSDFLKARFGKTSIDTHEGFQQYIVSIARLIRNEQKSSTSGNIMKYGEGYKPMTRASEVERLLRTKLSPSTGFIWSGLAGTTPSGETFDVKKHGLELVTPMILKDINELLREEEFEELWRIVPAVYGAGISTYPRGEEAKARRKAEKKKAKAGKTNKSTSGGKLVPLNQAELQQLGL